MIINKLEEGINRMNKEFTKYWRKNLLGTLFILTLSLAIAGCGGGGGGSSTGSSANSNISSGSLAIAWGAATDNVGVAGYKIYYGKGSGNYTESVDIGNSTSASINNLTAGTWCLVATAYDFSGNESGYSNEVCAVIS